MAKQQFPNKYSNEIIESFTHDNNDAWNALSGDIYCKVIREAAEAAPRETKKKQLDFVWIIIFFHTFLEVRVKYAIIKMHTAFNILHQAHTFCTHLRYWMHRYFFLLQVTIQRTTYSHISILIIILKSIIAAVAAGV